MRDLAIVSLIIVGAIVVLAAAQGPGKKRTYADVAQEYAQQCVAKKGDGQWRGSSGVTLETFCQFSGKLRAHGEMCKEYPEDC